MALAQTTCKLIGASEQFTARKAKRRRETFASPKFRFTFVSRRFTAHMGPSLLLLLLPTESHGPVERPPTGCCAIVRRVTVVSSLRRWRITIMTLAEVASHDDDSPEFSFKFGAFDEDHGTKLVSLARLFADRQSDKSHARTRAHITMAHSAIGGPFS